MANVFGIFDENANNELIITRITNYLGWSSLILEKATSYFSISLKVVSLSHGCDEAHKRIHFHCANEGKTIVYLEAKPKVWGQAVRNCGVTDECDYAYTCVHFSGKIFLVDDLDEKYHTMEVMMR